MDKNLITTGEFAKLSESTKRTVLWYTQKGLLHPVRINSRGYRFYSPEQIIDFQVIILLRRLNFSLMEIKKFLRQNSSPKKLFLEKKQIIKDEIKYLQVNLRDINKYYNVLEKEGLLVKPIIKTVKSFPIYYIERIGSYAKIPDYCLELKSYFSKLPENAIFLTIFSANKYLPKKDNLKIGVVVKSNMKLKKEYKNLVKKEIVSGFKALSYTHIGSPALISMFWKQMRNYKDKHRIKRDYSLPFFELEFYKKGALNNFYDSDNMISELNLPIAKII